MILNLILPTEINGLYIFKKKQLSVSIKKREIFATVSTVYKKDITIEKSIIEPIVDANENQFDNISATLARISAWAGKVDFVTCGIQPELTIYMQSEFPFKKHDAIELVLKNEIAKTLPLNTENIVADFLIESESGSGCKTISAISQKENVLSLIALFKNININLDKIAPESLAIYEYLNLKNLIEDNSVVIDIDQSSTTIFCIENKAIKSIRTINKGHDIDDENINLLISDILFTVQSMASTSAEFSINMLPCKNIESIKKLIKTESGINVNVIDSISDIYSQALAYAAITMVDFNLIPDAYNYNKNLLTLQRFFAGTAIILLIIITLFLNNFIKLYRAESVLKSNKAELQKNISKNFKVKNIKSSPAALVKEIKKSLDSEISLWMPYTDKNRTKYTKLLEELSKIINPKEINISIEEMNLNDSFVMLKGLASDFEALNKFEDLVEKSNIFKMQSRPQTTKFEVKLIYGLSEE